MKSTRILLLSLLFLLFLSIPNPAHAREFTVSSDFIKMIVLINSSSVGNSKEIVYEQLMRMDQKNLNIIRNTILDDIKSKRGDYVIPLPVEQSMAYQIIYKIDDMLGELKYDKILIGRFDNIVSGKNHSASIFDISNNIIQKEVIYPIEILIPYSGYNINNNDILKIYMKYNNTSKLWYAIKIDIIEYK